MPTDEVSNPEAKCLESKTVGRCKNQPQNAQITNLRLDAAIATYSKYQLAAYLGVTAVLLFMAYLNHLGMWGLIALLFASILAVLGHLLTRRPLVHLTQPVLTQEKSAWLLLVATARQNQLWHGNLTKLQDYGFAVVLHFEVTHPQRRRVSYAIFCDQISPQGWYQLKVLSAVS